MPHQDGALDRAFIDSWGLPNQIDFFWFLLIQWPDVDEQQHRKTGRNPRAHLQQSDCQKQHHRKRQRSRDQCLDQPDKRCFAKRGAGLCRINAMAVATKPENAKTRACARRLWMRDHMGPRTAWDHKAPPPPFSNTGAEPKQGLMNTVYVFVPESL